MKKLIGIAFFCSMYISSLAQKSITEVCLDYVVTFNKDGVNYIKDTCRLTIIDSKKSFFWSIGKIHYEKRIDEMLENDISGDSNIEPERLLAGNFYPFTVIKEYEKSEVYILEKVGDIFYGYKEDSNALNQDWIVTSSTKKVDRKILKQAIRKSESGLNLTVWFDPSINIPDGPFTNFGLPGLVYNLERSDGLSATLFKHTMDCVPIASEPTFQMSTKVNIQKIKEEHRKAMLSNGGIKMEIKKQ